MTEENLSSISLPGSDISMNKLADFVDSQKLKAFMNTSYDPGNTQAILLQYADYCMNVNPGPTSATPPVPTSTTGLSTRSQKRKIDDGSTTQEGLPGAKRQLMSLPISPEDVTNTVRAGSNDKDADVDMQASAPLLSLDAANADKTTPSSSEKQPESTHDPLPTQEPGRYRENGVAKNIEHPAEPTKKCAQKGPSKTKSSSNDATGAKTDGKAERAKKTTTGGKIGGKNKSKNTKKEKKDDDDHHHDDASENEFFTFTPGIDQSLPALSDIQDIFNDITSRAYESGFNEAVDLLDGRVINVATICSGTESPLLALDMICDALKRIFKKELQFKHLFSAEIVPFKQAYIERNFAPAILFRDTREIAEAKQKGGKAHTAYGALADVPNNVHLLIAGFSCVDLSKLSRWNKKLTDLGESGDTFRSILRYAK
ncbi:hypothetical protein ABVK25_007072 [Lepraria finkii]|uniref:Uncharacterized protein n=1 Tax=Lepraria finkii TaxID=1340010 RepID=A0ABR4B3P3_9LECA